MADQDGVTTQPAAGVPEQTSGSQDSTPGSQDPGQNQNAGSQSGRTDEPDASSNGDREKPSYYYENRKLNTTVRQLQQQMQQMAQQQQDFFTKSQQPSSPQSTSQPGWKDPNAIFAKPVETLDELRQQIISELTGKLPQTFQQMSQQQELQRQMREAGNLLQQNESVRKNPHGMEIIEDILSDPQYRLNEMSNQFPREAANLALAIYNSKINGGQPRNQTIPTKGQMVSTATGSVPNGGRLDFNNEFAKLQQELESDNSKALDPEFMKRFNAVQSAWKQQRMSGS